MKQFFCIGIILATISCCSLSAALDRAKIDEITGLKGKFNQKEGVYKITFPRNDVKVVVDGKQNRAQW
jgi:hypothetical protein